MYFLEKPGMLNIWSHLQCENVLVNQKCNGDQLFMTKFERHNGLALSESDIANVFLIRLCG